MTTRADRDATTYAHPPIYSHGNRDNRHPHDSPTRRDTDGDSIDDNIEIGLGTDPTDEDTDGDDLDDDEDAFWVFRGRSSGVWSPFVHFSCT